MSSDFGMTEDEWLDFRTSEFIHPSFFYQIGLYHDPSEMLRLVYTTPTALGPALLAARSDGYRLVAVRRVEIEDLPPGFLLPGWE